MKYLPCFTELWIRSISSPTSTKDDHSWLRGIFPLPRLGWSLIQVSYREKNSSLSRFRQTDRVDPPAGRPLQMVADRALYSDVP